MSEDKPKDDENKKLPISPGRFLRTSQEKLLESKEGKLERLMDLTGIEKEEELVDIYTELLEVIRKIEVGNISYEKNTENDRYGTEKQFVFKNLDGSELEELELVLKKLRIFGFPEPVENSNYVNLFIENKRDLEVLRLITVSDFIKRELEVFEFNKRMQEREEERKIAERKKFEDQRRLEQEVRDAQERHVRELEEQRKKANIFLGEDERRVMRKRISESMRFDWREKDKEKALKEAQERAEKERREIDKEEKKKIKDAKFAEIIKILEKIEPQVFGVSEAALDMENDVFHEVSGFGGYLPEEFPSSGMRSKKENILVSDAELDPVELVEEMDRFKEKWFSGEIVDEMDRAREEITGIKKNIKPDMNIFPEKYIWKRDSSAPGRKKLGKNRQYEYDVKTKKIGREITRQEREEVFQELKKIRAVRKEKENILREQKVTEKEILELVPKTKQEKDLESKFTLLTNNLILWLLRDLLGNSIRGNSEIKKVDINDLYQNAMMGVFYAVDNSDEEKKKSDVSIAYILACAEGYIRRLTRVGFEGEGNGLNFLPQQVRVPEHTINDRRKIFKISRLLSLEFPGQKITDEMIAVALSKPGIGIINIEGLEFENDKEKQNYLVSEYKNLREKYLMDYSEETADVLLSNNIDIDTQVDMLGNLLYENPNDSVEKEFEKKELREKIERTLATLTPREERILRLRFGIMGGKNYDNDHTLEETGANIGNITRERIRQIEAKALRKLRHPSRSRSFKSFL